MPLGQLVIFGVTGLGQNSLRLDPLLFCQEDNEFRPQYCKPGVAGRIAGSERTDASAEHVKAVNTIGAVDAGESCSKHDLIFEHVHVHDYGYVLRDSGSCK